MTQDNTATTLDTATDAGRPEEGTGGLASGGASPDAARALATNAAAGASGMADLALLGDIPVDLSMEIGRTRITIAELLGLGKGSVVELQRMADEPLDILVNGTLVAHGEAVVVGERFGIRLTDVVSPGERLGKLA